MDATNAPLLWNTQLRLETPPKPTARPSFADSPKLLTAKDQTDLIAVGWTFTGGEIIQGEKDIFEDFSPEFPEGTISDIEFGSLTKADTQSVELSINSSWLTCGWIILDRGAHLGHSSRVRLGFVGYKGSNTTSPTRLEVEAAYQVALPENFLVDELFCQAAPFLFQSEQYVSQPEQEGVQNLETGIRLQYLPLEMRDLRFTSGLFSSTALFAFKLFNTHHIAANLSDVVVEYWFNGDDEDGIYELNTADAFPYESTCFIASIDCSRIETVVQRGLPNVQGAHYKVMISFAADAGILPPNQTEGSTSEMGNAVEVVVNITSRRVSSQMDVISDYSFMNTSVLRNNENDSGQLIARAYEENLRMPVYRAGKKAWGSRPIAGPFKVNVSDIDMQGNFCYLKSNAIPQCGLKMRYCCQRNASRGSRSFNLIGRPEGVLEGRERENANRGDKRDGSQIAENSRDDRRLSAWAVILVGSLSCFLMLCCIWFCCQHSAKKNAPPSFVTYTEAIVDPHSPSSLSQGAFGSFAWSIEHQSCASSSHAVRNMEIVAGNASQQRLLTEDGRSNDLFHPETKYHTVPSISESEERTLVQILERRESSSMSRISQTWAGCVHWICEPWDALHVRRAKTTSTPCKRLAKFETSTRNIENIPLDVDYATEIGPYLGALLGEGGFGQVYEATWKGQPVAVKLMRVDTEAMHKNLRDEVKLTSRICHERIVRLIAACLTDKNRICLIMELVENGSLSRRIHNRKLRKLEYIQVLQIGLDIAQGLNYLHPTIIHRDLKPQNVLLDQANRAKIADFGISKFKDPHRSYLSVTQTGGTPNYMAPELFNGTRVDEKCDIYSLGCILYESMTRKVPLSDLPADNCAPLFQIIKTVAIDKRRPKIPEYFPHGLARLIRQCWKDNPRSRPSAFQLCSALEKLIDGEIERMEHTRLAYRDAFVRPSGKHALS